MPDRRKRRRRSGPVDVLLRNPMVFCIVIAIVLCSVVTVYVSAYAKVTEKGYLRAQLHNRLDKVNMENQKLVLELSKLRKAESISDAAAKLNMKQSDKMAYLSPLEHPAVAQNVER